MFIHSTLSRSYLFHTEILEAAVAALVFIKFLCCGRPLLRRRALDSAQGRKQTASHPGRFPTEPAQGGWEHLFCTCIETRLDFVFHLAVLVLKSNSHYQLSK